MLSQESLHICTERFQTAYKELYASVLDTQYLKLSLTGSFSVGKSSLLNALIDDDLLPVAIEEKTAKPTILSFASEPHYLFLQEDDNTVISRETMQGISDGSIDHGDGFLMVGYPSPFLKDIQVIDLPGTSGNDPERRRVLNAQLETSDIVFYLLTLTGPGAADQENIRRLVQMGKTIHVIINKYDDDNISLALTTYKEALEDAGYTGELHLVSAHKNRGLDQLKSLISESVLQKEDIRLHRFQTLFQHLLNTEIQLLTEEHQLRQSAVDDNVTDVERKLLKQRQQVLEFKASLRESKRTQWMTLSSQMNTLKTQTVADFTQRCGELNTTNLDTNYTDEEWSRWLSLLEQTIHQSMNSYIASIPSNTEWFNPKTLEDMASLDISPPYTDQQEPEDFREAAKLQELQLEIAVLQRSNVETEIQDITLMQEVLQEQQAQYQMILDSHTEVSNIVVPMETRSSGWGTKIGSAIGNIADIGLLVVNPATAGAKVAGWIGKGGKLGSTIVKGAKAAKLIQEGASITKAGKTIGTAVEIAINTRKTNILGKFGIPILEDPKLQNKMKNSGVSQIAGVLEKFSAGYWGEKIGGLFDRKYQVENPEIAAKKVEQMNLLNTEMTTVQEHVQHIKSQIFQAEGDALQKRRLEIKLQQKEAELQKRQTEFTQWQQVQEQQKQQHLNEVVTRAITDSIQRAHRRLEARLLGVEHEFAKQFTAAYAEIQRSALDEKVALYNTVEQSLTQTTEEKRAAVEEISKQLDILEAIRTT